MENKRELFQACFILRSIKNLLQINKLVVAVKAKPITIGIKLDNTESCLNARASITPQLLSVYMEYFGLATELGFCLIIVQRLL